PATPPTGPQVLLLPPQAEQNTAEPPRADPGRKNLYPPEKEKELPKGSTKEPTIASYPVGIPGFDDRQRPGVTTGLRPTLEGLDWLQKQGYRAVVCLHVPGERVDADREQIEKRGMTFTPLEINPRQLTRETVDAFLKLQRDAAAGKLFIYDRDGVLT